MKETIATRIRRRMQELGTNPTKAAQQAGLPVDRIRNILRAEDDGRENSATISRLMEVATALETSVGFLIGEVDNPDTNDIPELKIIKDIIPNLSEEERKAAIGAIKGLAVSDVE